MTVTVDLKGFRELEAKLRALADSKEVKRAGREALRKAAEPIRDQAKALAPKDIHNLEKSIKTAATRGLKGDAAGVTIGIDRNVDPPVYRGRKRGKGSYRDPGVAGNAVIQEFGSERMAANPFMRPAWDAEKDATPRRIADALGTAIERAARRIARRGGQ
jgi:HK97 gp10 family phage protein